MLRFQWRSLRHLPAVFGLAPLLLIGGLGRAESATYSHLKDEEGQRFFKSFVVPNEPGYASFKIANTAKQGAFIGVGTFRVLAGASYGNFDEIVMADLDQTVVEFNEMQIRALRESVNVDAFLETLAREAGDLETFKDLAREYVMKLREFRETDRSESFLTNTARYAHLRHLALSHRIYSIAASLTGSMTYKKISDVLRMHGTRVSVLDVSNAPDYFVLAKTGAKSLVEAYYANLHEIPWAPGAVINFTTEYMQDARGQAVKGWHYTSTPIPDYLQLYSEVVKYHEMEDYRWILRKLYDSRDARLCSSIFAGVLK